MRTRAPYFYKRPTGRSRTGVVGVGYSAFIRDGKPVSYFTVNAGRVRRFNIARLGRKEAFRRAVETRANHELALKGAMA
jgi:hypothetical protein